MSTALTLARELSVVLITQVCVNYHGRVNILKV